MIETWSTWLPAHSIAGAALCASLLGCGSKPPAEAPATADAPAPVERPSITADECTTQGGTVVGDIGDGAIHEADYRCPSGAQPSGSIESSSAGPTAVEGSVCCPG